MQTPGVRKEIAANFKGHQVAATRFLLDALCLETATIYILTRTLSPAQIVFKVGSTIIS